MMNWILIAVVVLLTFILFKSKEVKHKIGLILGLVLMVFFIVTFSQVISSPGVDFKTFEGITNAGRLYFSWLGHVAGNIAQLTGNAVKLDWDGNFTTGLS